MSIVSTLPCVYDLLVSSVAVAAAALEDLPETGRSDVRNQVGAYSKNFGDAMESLPRNILALKRTIIYCKQNCIYY